MSYAPVVLFAYNRPDHTLRTLEALKANTIAAGSELIIYCDGPKESATAADLQLIRETRAAARRDRWCGEVSVIERETNLGLADSIRTGVTETLERCGRVIVLEDDIVTSKGFLRFMNDSLDTYLQNEQVMHIGGYVPETRGLRPKGTFFSRFMSCWGWATWKRAWSKAEWDAQELLKRISSRPATLRHYNLDGYISFDEQLKANIDGRIRTWAIKWFTSIYLNDGLCLYPGRSMVRNIGLDGSGQHYTDRRDISESAEYVEHLLDFQEVRPQPVREDRRGRYYLKKFYRFGKRTDIAREIFFLLKTTYEGLAHRHF